MIFNGSPVIGASGVYFVGMPSASPHGLRPRNDKKLGPLFEAKEAFLGDLRCATRGRMTKYEMQS